MQSFYAVQTIHDRITELVGMFTVPIVLVGGKCDDEESREVSFELAAQLAQRWGCPYVECSAKTNVGVQDVFVTLLFDIESESGLLKKPAPAGAAGAWGAGDADEAGGVPHVGASQAPPESATPQQAQQQQQQQQPRGRRQGGGGRTGARGGASTSSTCVVS